MIPRRRSAVLLALLSVVGAPAAAQQADAAARFNGTWEWRQGRTASARFRIWALDERRLQVEFLGLYRTRSELGPTANSGQAAGVAVVERGKATFRSRPEERGCWFILHLRLRGDQMVVNESGNTCFGFNVFATGTYHRVSRDRPTFELGEPTRPADPNAPE